MTSSKSRRGRKGTAFKKVDTIMKSSPKKSTSLVTHRDIEVYVEYSKRDLAMNEEER